MKTLKIVVSIAAVTVIGGAGFVYSGIYPIGADTPHWPLTVRLIETLREHSISAGSRDIEVPTDLADAGRVRRGVGNYDAMCVGCHLKPGLKDSEIRKGLYPQPPNLAERADHGGAQAVARQFWIIKHGIKLTGMPAWSKAGVDDATIWNVVALLQKLPELSPAEYTALVEASEGHRHAGQGHMRGDGHMGPPAAATQGPRDQSKPENSHEGHHHAH